MKIRTSKNGKIENFEFSMKEYQKRKNDFKAKDFNSITFDFSDEYEKTDLDNLHFFKIMTYVSLILLILFFVFLITFFVFEY